jgi:HD superfamily phosphodiesterase
MKDSALLLKAQEHIIGLFKTKLPTEVVYHNYNHTLDVVNAAKEIGEGMSFSTEDLEILLLAAWFHDTGFVDGCSGHESNGKEKAKLFLEENKYDTKNIEKVLGCIQATQMPQEPKNILEEAMCDADLFHLGKKDFSKRSKLLKLEWEARDCKEISEEEWLEMSVSFLASHKYFTDYAFKTLNDTKVQNWLEAKKELKKLQNKNNEKDAKKILKNEEKKLKQAKETKPEKGIETMFRVTLRNHIKLSDIADTKANILLSVNAIILSIALANLVPKLDKESNSFLIIPTLVFIITAVFSIIGAIISTRPKVTSGAFSRKDIEEKKVNLLFFGNFYKMPLEDFNWGVQKLMGDKEYLYGSMTKDLYFLGLVLARKYRLLRITYTVFMIGIIASVISFIVAFLNIPNELITTVVK